MNKSALLQTFENFLEKVEPAWQKFNDIADEYLIPVQKETEKALNRFDEEVRMRALQNALEDQDSISAELAINFEGIEKKLIPVARILTETLMDGAEATVPDIFAVSRGAENVTPAIEKHGSKSDPNYGRYHPGSANLEFQGVGPEGLSLEERISAARTLTAQIFQEWGDNERSTLAQTAAGNMFAEGRRGILVQDQGELVGVVVQSFDDFNQESIIDYLATKRPGYGERTMKGIAENTPDVGITLNALPGAVGFYEQLDMEATIIRSAGGGATFHWPASEVAKFAGIAKRRKTLSELEPKDGIFVIPDKKSRLKKANDLLEGVSIAGSIGISFDQAEKWAAENAGIMITQVTDQTKLGVRDIIARSIADGIPPRASAREIRQIVGLTQRQANSVINFKRDLEDQMARGKSPFKTVPLTQPRIDRMTDKFSKKQLRFRSEMIARTETIRSSNMGQQAIWEQAAERGLIDENVAVRRWVVTEDDRLCDFCRPMDGQTVPLRGQFQSGIVELKAGGLRSFDPTLTPPLHPQCLVSPRTPIFTSKGWKQVNQVEVGDLVLTHKNRFRKVTTLIQTPRQTPTIVKIRTYGEKTLTVTDNHPILVDGKWIEAKDVKPGQKVKYMANDEEYSFVEVEITKVEKRKAKKPIKLFNFSVEEDESYVAKGFIVHNCRCAMVLDIFPSDRIPGVDKPIPLPVLPTKFSDFENVRENLRSGENLSRIADFNGEEWFLKRLDNTEAINELIASNVGEYLGVEVPEIISFKHRGDWWVGTKSLNEKFPGARTARAFFLDEFEETNFKGFKAELSEVLAFQRMQIFDALIGNLDRHAGNYFIVGSEGNVEGIENILAIDHGLADFGFDDVIDFQVKQISKISPIVRAQTVTLLRNLTKELASQWVSDIPKGLLSQAVGVNAFVVDDFVSRAKILAGLLS